MTRSEIPKTRRHFDPAYKPQVAKRIRKQCLSVSQVCKDMDLSTSAVHRWLQQYDMELAGHCGIGKPLTPEHQRIRELEKQLRQLKSDNELLKKASALFAREIR